MKLGGRRVLGPLDLEIGAGSFVGILGPNGSGKTTLLRALIGGVPPSAGEILLEGRPVQEYRAAQLARMIGVVPQQFNLDFTFTVEEMVAMGRYAHGGRGEATPGDLKEGPHRPLRSCRGKPRWPTKPMQAARPTTQSWPPPSRRPA